MVFLRSSRILKPLDTLHLGYVFSFHQFLCYAFVSLFRITDPYLLFILIPISLFWFSSVGLTLRQTIIICTLSILKKATKNTATEILFFYDSKGKTFIDAFKGRRLALPPPYKSAFKINSIVFVALCQPFSIQFLCFAFRQLVREE